MGSKSNIEWTDASWTPIRAMVATPDGPRFGWHCEHISEGCRNCYAESMNKRLGTGVEFKPGVLAHVNKFGEPRGEVSIFLDETMLLAPLRWKKPRRIFVCSMTDLFADFVPDAWIDRIFAVMALAPQHTFQLLTKRSKRMREHCSNKSFIGRVAHQVLEMKRHGVISAAIGDETIARLHFGEALPNLWLGVSAEDQTRADERIPDLLATPAAVRFVSAEPLLGPIDFTALDIGGDAEMNALRPSSYAEVWRDCWSPEATGEPLDECIEAFVDEGGVYPPTDTRPPGLDWIIVGGESGPGARPCWVPGVRTIVRQCQSAGVAVFVKQLGANVQDRNDAGFEGNDPHEWPDIDPATIEHDVNGFREDYQGAPCRTRLKDRKGGDMTEWPVDLRIREEPRR